MQTMTHKPYKFTLKTQILIFSVFILLSGIILVKIYTLFLHLDLKLLCVYIYVPLFNRVRTAQRLPASYCTTNKWARFFQETNIANGGERSYRLRGLQPDTLYMVKMNAYNRMFGNGHLSSARTFRTKKKITLGPPLNIMAEKTPNGLLKIMWSPPADVRSMDQLESYQVYLLWFHWGGVRIIQ